MVVRDCLWKKIMQKKSEIQFFERKYEQKKVLLKAYGKFSLRRNMQINRWVGIYEKIFFKNCLRIEKIVVFLQLQNRKKEMAKKNKDARVQVILECTEQKTSGVPGMSRYVTTKNKKNTPERLELKKYNPFLKKVTVHKEIK